LARSTDAFKTRAAFSVKFSGFIDISHSLSLSLCCGGKGGRAGAEL
jgi:hypothetical protein